MALMDMAEIGPLARGLVSLLKPDGRLVFSVTHPCFNSAGTSRVVEEYRDEEGIQQRRAIKVDSYITPRQGKRLGSTAAVCSIPSTGLLARYCGASFRPALCSTNWRSRYSSRRKSGNWARDASRRSHGRSSLGCGRRGVRSDTPMTAYCMRSTWKPTGLLS